MGRTQLLGGLGVVLALLTVMGGVAVAVDAPAPPPAVAIDGQRLSVRLTKVPLARVLNLILDRIAAELTLLGDADGEVTVQFDDVPLEQGLRRLLGARSYVLVYRSEDAGPPPGSRLKILSDEADRNGARPGPPVHRGAAVPLPAGSPRDPHLLAAVEAGGSGGTPAERANFLERVLTTEADADTRSMALKTLTTVSPSPLAAIARTALQDSSADVRRRALELLVINGKQSRLVIDTLLAVAGTDPDAGIRERAMVFAKNLDPSLP